MSDPFLESKKWKRLREAILARDGYMCQYCKRFGKRIAAEHVHHVLPREFFPELSYTAWNLISLCKDCHDKMHNRTDRTLTDKGKELAKIVARKNFIDLEDILRRKNNIAAEKDIITEQPQLSGKNSPPPSG